MRQPTILIVLLNYKTASMTLKAAQAALEAMDGLDGELLIVDNDSQDGSYEYLKKQVEQQGWTQVRRVHVVASGHNGGFGAGNNFGIRCDQNAGRFHDRQSKGWVCR